jgi:ethanolamine utilization cobalamin adenosyltransferase
MINLILMLVVMLSPVELESDWYSCWTDEDIEEFVEFWHNIMSVEYLDLNVLLYHSHGCNICE